MESHSSKSQSNCSGIPGRNTPASACGATRQKGGVDVDADGKRHRLPFCHQPSAPCLSTFAAVKRSERCFDILYTSRARTPATAPPHSVMEMLLRRRRMLGGAARCASVFTLNRLSTRFTETWPFSDSLNVRHFPLRVKRKDGTLFFFPPHSS